jgi:membrane protein
MKILRQKGWKILKATFSSFVEDKGLKLSASLAYTTIFSLGPLLLLIMSLASIFFGQDAIEGKIFSQVNGLLGVEAAKQIQDIIKNIQFSGKTNFALTVSIITLLVGSTSLFVEIQDSLNMIWRVKAKPKRGWLNFLKNRLLSASLIVSLGFLLVVSLIISGTILALSESLTKYLSNFSVLLITIINFILTFLITSFIFGIVFKILPDVKIKWKNVKAGAIFTAIFFMGGRYLIGLYIEKTATGSTYGAAGAIIIILVWVYFASAILYVGAEFTQVYSEAMGTRIEPSGYAVHVEEKEHEKNVSVLPLRHKELQEKK